MGMGVMHDEYDSPNYIERKPLGPYGGPMIMMSGKTQIPMMGFFSLVLVKVSVCVCDERNTMVRPKVD